MVDDQVGEGDRRRQNHRMQRKEIEGAEQAAGLLERFGRVSRAYITPTS